MPRAFASAVAVPNGFIASSFRIMESSIVWYTESVKHAIHELEYSPVMDNLNERILEARTHAGLSQEVLGKKIGVTRGAVCAWEKGRTKSLKATNMIKLAKCCGVSLEWLMYDRGAMLDVSADVSDTASMIAHVWDGLSIETRSIIWGIVSSKIKDQIDRRIEILPVIHDRRQ